MMLLSALTPDELDRLAAVDPARPGLAEAFRAACQREVDHVCCEARRLRGQLADAEALLEKEYP